MEEPSFSVAHHKVGCQALIVDIKGEGRQDVIKWQDLRAPPTTPRSPSAWKP